jgi:uncharacterized damage-inducible protein DinB
MSSLSQIHDNLMITQTIRTLYLRELRALRREIEAYPDEALLWATRAGITNTAGNLALHLCGNLQHYVGARLGDTAYVRNRDAEFARRDVSRAEILAEIDAATAAVRLGFGRINDADLETPYPEAIANRTLTTGEWLVHLVAHLGYHLGQIDYHRRMVTGDATTLDMISVRELPSVTAAT